MCATLSENVYHAAQRMQLAVHHIITTFGIEPRSIRAGVVSATLAENVYHAKRSMRLAVRHLLVALDVNGQKCRAGGM